MIIGFPTALYQSVLPTNSSDPSDITWLISSTDPPRQTQSTMLVSAGVELTPLPVRTFDHSTRFPAGDYVFNLTLSNSSKAEDGNKLYECGQLLEFVDETVDSVINSTVPDQIDIQQNTNVLDLSGAGLTEDEINLLNSTAWTKYNDVIAKINVVKTDIQSLSVDIANNQKKINEVRKIKDAAITINLTSIVEKLTLEETGLLNQRITLINNINAKNLELNALYNELIKLKEVIR